MLNLKTSLLLNLYICSLNYVAAALLEQWQIKLMFLFFFCKQMLAYYLNLSMDGDSIIDREKN